MNSCDELAQFPWLSGVPRRQRRGYHLKCIGFFILSFRPVVLLSFSMMILVFYQWIRLLSWGDLYLALFSEVGFSMHSRV